MVRVRYMVVLRLGGMYADMDTECVKPLNDLIEPRDTMLVGWENEFPNLDHARFRSYARERQVGSHSWPSHTGPSAHSAFLPAHRLTTGQARTW